VLAGGKAGDSIKGLPIGTGRELVFAGSFFICMERRTIRTKKFQYALGIFEFGKRG